MTLEYFRRLPSDLAKIAGQHAEWTVVRAGITLHRQGSRVSHVWLPIDGPLELWRDGSQTGEVPPGCAIGETSLLLNETSSWDVLASQDLSAVSLPGRVFHGLLGDSNFAVDAARRQAASVTFEGNVGATPHREPGTSRARFWLRLPPVEPSSVDAVMRFGIHLSQFGRAAGPDAISRAVRLVEELGFADVWVSDQVNQPANQGYPSPSPLWLANGTASLDAISEGRLKLAVGVAGARSNSKRCGRTSTLAAHGQTRPCRAASRSGFQPN